jgi:tripartite-type tricarboxylate transporter receptor subunit TctC
MRRELLWFVATILMLPFAPALAQSYPVKTIRLVGPFPPGGSNDFVSRIIARKLDENWGQRVVVDNRPGGNGVIGTQIVARSAPDGYTVLFVPAAHAISAALNSNLPYDPIKDFAPVTNIASAPNVLVVHPSLPAKSVRELIALAKARPGQLTYGSAGVGYPSHLAAEMLNSMAGTSMVHVPYRGAGPAMTDLMAGQIQLSFPSLPGALPHLRSGRLRALAVTSTRRSSVMPGLPTVGETLPGYATETWFGLFMPAGTPGDIIAKMNAEIVRIIRMPDVREQLSAQGADPIGSSPEEFAAYVKAEIEKWSRVIKQAGVRAE